MGYLPLDVNSGLFPTIARLMQMADAVSVSTAKEIRFFIQKN